MLLFCPRLSHSYDDLASHLHYKVETGPGMSAGVFGRARHLCIMANQRAGFEVDRPEPRNSVR